MQPVKVIGLAGPLESGKDTVAAILKEHGYVQVSYGRHIRAEVEEGDTPKDYWIPDKIKAIIRQLERFPDERKKVWDKPTSPDMRALLQWWGQVRWDINPNYWNARLGAEITKLPQGNGRIVVSDVRRPVEFYYTMNMVPSLVKPAGENWLIERIVVDYNPFRHHETETALRGYKFDAYVDNTQDLVRLKHSVRLALEAYDKEACDSCSA